MIRFVVQSRYSFFCYLYNIGCQKPVHLQSSPTSSYSFCSICRHHGTLLTSIYCSKCLLVLPCFFYPLESIFRLYLMSECISIHLCLFLSLTESSALCPATCYILQWFLDTRCGVLGLVLEWSLSYERNQFCWEAVVLSSVVRATLQATLCLFFFSESWFLDR